MPRIFVAIVVPPPVARALAAGLSPALPSLRLVAPELMHLTLAFLGSTPEERLPEVVESARRAAAAVPAFSIRPGALGLPRSPRPRLVWVEPSEGGVEIGALGAALRAELDRRRLAYDRKPLRAHITLARLRDGSGGGDVRALAGALRRTTQPEGLRFDVRALDVIESTLSSAGPAYRTRATVPLGETVPRRPSQD